MLELAKIEQLKEINEIVEKAKVLMRADGLQQWQNGYPNQEVLIKDLENKNLYVYLIAGKVAGIVVINDDYYQQYQNTPSATECLMIHRVAVAEEFRNQKLGIKILNEALNIIKAKGFKYAIVDTNSKNLKMLKIIKATGFQYCSDFILQKDLPAWQVFMKVLI
ncbi:MAG: GNAT family N-acetyltransferase [Erysipelotrichaceae bacterium]